MAWNDYTDWTSLDTVRLTAPLDGILPVVKAVNERCAAAGLAIITEPARLDAIAVMSTVQNKVTTLIPLFVNHTINGGDFTGLSSIPMFMEATMLTAIGAESRLPAPSNLAELAVDWLYQQYLILNKLIWVNTKTTTVIDGSVRAFALVQSGVHPTMEAAVDDAITNATNYPYNWIWMETQCFAAYTPPDPAAYKAACFSGQAKFTWPAIPGSSFNSEADVYFFAQKQQAGNFTAVFDGAGIAIENMNLLISLPLQQISSYTTAIIGAAGTFPVYPPVPDPGTASARGWGAGFAHFISKFNVPGGFEFT